MSISPRLTLLTLALVGAASFSTLALADGDKSYPSFKSLAGSSKMIDRDIITPALEKKYPKLEGLKSHWTRPTWTTTASSTRKSTTTTCPSRTDALPPRYHR